MKKLLYIGLVLLTTNAVKAQQLTFNSQYMMNQYLINPAAAGTQDYTSIATSFRQQWAGFKDAPRTQMLTANGKIGESMGVGGILYNDVTGPLRNIGITGSYAYHIKTSDNTKLSLGLSLSLVQHVLDGSAFLLHDEVDQTLNGASMKSLNPDAAFGAYYYGENFFLGAAVPQLIQKKYNFGDSKLDSTKHVRHYYISGGSEFELSDDFDLEPSVLFKATEASPIQFDINARLIYKENLWIGASYRNKESVVAMLGMKRENFLIGYSYDYLVSKIRNYSAGTHELYIEFQIGKKQSKASFGHKTLL
jgi:type IX secretion system PorP/SprF family membrane protein